jgi:hypothetical protein
MLNTRGCNILDGIPREQYTKCLDVIRDLILGKCDVNTRKKLLNFKIYKFIAGYKIAGLNHCVR